MVKFKRAGGLLLLAMTAALLLLVMDNRPEYTSETPLELRLQAILNGVLGAGDVRLMVNEAPDGEIIGVCVLSDAADDVAAVLRIQRAVQTALGIDNDRIEVIRMEEESP